MLINANNRNITSELTVKAIMINPNQQLLDAENLILSKIRSQNSKRIVRVA